MLDQDEIDRTAPPTARDRRRAQTYREILHAAWALSREHGLAALSMRELGARVGLRAPSLYSYFPSKDAIYDAMFAAAQRQLADHMAFLPDADITRDDLHTGAHAFAAFCTADPTRYQLMFQRVIPDFEPSAESYGLAVANLDRLRNHLDAAGFHEPSHVDLWTAVMAGITSQQMTNDPGGDRWIGLLDDIVELLCDHAGLPR